MNNLINLQDQFQAYLLGIDNQIENLIVNTENVSIALRLQIYGNAYRARLLEALESTYTVLKIYIGDDNFYALMDDYIDAHPSTYRSIRWFGDKLPEFLTNHHSFCDYPYLSELAQIEWMMTSVFDAADGALLTAEELCNLPDHAWNQLQIQFHPSVHLLNLSWNAFEIWQTISDDEEPPEPVCSSHPVVWVLWRNDLINYYSSLADDEAWAINMVMQDYTFEMLCEGLSRWAADDEAAVMRAASLLKGWVSSGMVVKTGS